MNNLNKRLITGLIYGITLISSLLVSPLTFILFFFFISLLALNEYFKMIEKINLSPYKTIGFFISVFLFFTLLTSQVYNQLFQYFYISLIVCFIILILTPLKQLKNQSINNLSSTLLGIFYVSMPFALINLIAFKNNIYDYQTILSVFILVWLSDIGGYVVGVKFGKRKLLERISPKKSWEGVFGSLIFCVIGAYFLSQNFDFYNMIEWFIFSILICVGSILGDLIESMLKRNAKIKDSGTILPGHGGILDRFDSIIFVLPIVYLFQIIIK